MWCGNCQSEVAAEISADNQSIHCSTCLTEIASSSELKMYTKTKQAQELLERWSDHRLLDPYGPLLGPQAGSPLESSDSEPKTSSSEINMSEDSESLETSSSKPKFRIDAGHVQSEQNHPETQQPARETRLDAAHHASFSAPHFELSHPLKPITEKKTNWVAVIGQILAYAGVGLLTVGTTFIIWGYFGGPERYTPTGWLVTNAGQMLLFLGVITLVSGGLEQTTEEVKRRIETLGEKIIRIEQATENHHLQGPHLPLESFQDHSSISEHPFQEPDSQSQQNNPPLAG